MNIDMIKKAKKCEVLIQFFHFGSILVKDFINFAV